MEQVWARLGDAPPTTTPAATDAAWERLSSRLHLEDQPSETELPPASRRRASDRAAAPSRRRRFSTRWVTAGVAALALVAFSLWTVPTLVAPVSVQAAPGSAEVIALPDGSTVTLAAGSRLTYAKRFGTLLGSPDERQVALVGEAAFDVESGDAPFVVETFNASVEVVGTRFAVRAHWREAETRVTVEEGVVRVEAAGETVELTAAETTTVAGDDTAPTTPEVADPARALAFVDGGLAFDDLPLADAFREIERRYGVQIQAGGNVNTSADVTAFYASAPEVKTVLGDLCAANGLRFEATSRGFTVSTDGSRSRSLAPRPSSPSSATPR